MVRSDLNVILCTYLIDTSVVVSTVEFITFFKVSSNQLLLAVRQLFSLFAELLSVFMHPLQFVLLGPVP